MRTQAIMQDRKASGGFSRLRRTTFLFLFFFLRRAELVLDCIPSDSASDRVDEAGDHAASCGGAEHMKIYKTKRGRNMML